MWLRSTGTSWSHGLFRKFVHFYVLRTLLIVCRYFHSSSCAVRSAISCYNIAHKFVFETNLLKEKDNEIVLRLPADAMDYESAVLPQQVYVQYDALRLELQ